MNYRNKDLDDSPVKINRKSNKKRVLDDSSDDEKEINKENGKNKGNVKVETELQKTESQKEEKNSNDTVSNKRDDQVVPPKRKTGIYCTIIQIQYRRIF